MHLVLNKVKGANITGREKVNHVFLSTLLKRITIDESIRVHHVFMESHNSKYVYTSLMSCECLICLDKRSMAVCTPTSKR